MLSGDRTENEEGCLDIVITEHLQELVAISFKPVRKRSEPPIVDALIAHANAKPVLDIYREPVDELSVKYGSRPGQDLGRLSISRIVILDPFDQHGQSMPDHAILLDHSAFQFVQTRHQLGQLHRTVV